MVKLMYFAQLAETLDCTSEQVTLPASVGNVSQLVDWLGRREDACWKALAGDKVAVMVNRQPAAPETAIKDGDEIAFIPERLK
ncbi:MAG: MoaD/ThiS family protein [Gammaproteobacteria bacterium]|nr:MoaD/ThiS family protein [Gammaproteobacteria bacterium]MBU1979567.1 MoaD/ThiS family protein [Gammaproteobacteria bacterium]